MLPMWPKNGKEASPKKKIQDLKSLISLLKEELSSENFMPKERAAVQYSVHSSSTLPLSCLRAELHRADLDAPALSSTAASGEMMKNLAKEGHFAHKYKEGLGVRYHGPHPGNQRRTILADGVITGRTYHSYNHDSWDVRLTVMYNPPCKLNTPLPARGVSERNMTPLHHIKAEQFKAKAKAKADAEAKNKADAYAASIQSPQVKPPSPPPESARNASKLTSCCRGKRKAVIAKEGELSELDSDAPAALDILTNETVEAFWEENPSSLVDCRVNIKKRSKKGLITGKATVVSFNRNTRVHKLRFDSGKLLLVPMESTTFEHLVGKDDRLAGKYTIYNNQLPRKEFGSLGISVHNAAKGITEGMKRKRPVVETQPQGASGGVAAKTNARTPHGGYTRTNPSAKAPGKPTGDSTVKSPLQNQPSADHEKSPLHPFGDVLTSFTDIVNDGLSNGYKECENFLGEVAKNVTAEWSGVPNDNLSSSGNFVAAVLQASESVAMKRTSAEAAKAAEEKAKLQAAAEVKAAAAAAAAARAKGEAAAKAKAKKEEAAKVRAEAEARVRAGAAAAQAKAEAAAAQAKAQEKEARAKAVAAAAQAKAKADAAAEAKAKDEAKAKEAALAAAAAEEAEASAAFDDRSRFGSDFHQRAASKSAAQKQLFGQLDVGKVVVVSWENGEGFYGEVMDVDQSNRRRPSKGLIGSMATHLIKYETGVSFWQDMWEEQYLVLDSDDSEPPQKKSPPSKSRKKKGAQELDARVPGAFADVDYGSINQQRAEEETEPAFEVKISAKDLQRIKEFTNEYQDLETGGDLFGGWHPDGSCTITAITGPGENAKRTSTTWNQSEEFMVSHLPNIYIYSEPPANFAKSIPVYSDSLGDNFCFRWQRVNF